MSSGYDNCRNEQTLSEIRCNKKDRLRSRASKKRQPFSQQVSERVSRGTSVHHVESGREPVTGSRMRQMGNVLAPKEGQK